MAYKDSQRLVIKKTLVSSDITTAGVDIARSVGNGLIIEDVVVATDAEDLHLELPLVEFCVAVFVVARLPVGRGLTVEPAFHLVLEPAAGQQAERQAESVEENRQQKPAQRSADEQREFLHDFLYAAVDAGGREQCRQEREAGQAGLCNRPK